MWPLLTISVTLYILWKILHWSYGKVDILCQNSNMNSTIMKVKAGQVLRCAPFQKLKSIGKCNLYEIHDFMWSSIRLCTTCACRKSRLGGSFVNMWCHRLHRLLTPCTHVTRGDCATLTIGWQLGLRVNAASPKNAHFTEYRTVTLPTNMAHPRLFDDDDIRWIGSSADDLCAQ